MKRTSKEFAVIANDMMGYMGDIEFTEYPSFVQISGDAGDIHVAIYEWTGRSADGAVNVKLHYNNRTFAYKIYTENDKAKFWDAFQRLWWMMYCNLKGGD